MSWHDMYPHDRGTRQKDVLHFWETVDAPGLAFMQKRHEFSRDKIRWRMTYHACERLEAGLRDIVAPRETLWAVMAIGLYHMNNAKTRRHINMVPDTFEVFCGSDDSFLPTLFVRLLWLCMRSPREGEEQNWDGRTDGFDGNQELRRFVEQFRIVDRLTGMKADVRSIVNEFIREGSLKWLKDVTWFFPALRIPPD
ncbi:hypothetical protein F4801DRAFT_325777 [Xylaria longipes]|nr:hypothetical protein F4801DRAFT_325777 [Xylaria longipes]